MKIKAKSFIVLYLFFVLLILSINTVGSEKDTYNTPSFDYITHDPIEILSNVDFTTYSSGGNGTSMNPYIIENYYIESTGGFMSSGIFVSSTTAHFIIRNCYIIADYIGIRLYQIATGTARICNNTCISSTADGGGIGVGWSSGCYIENNTMINFMQGIHLNEAHSCTIKNNVAKDNNYQGINIRFSNNNIIKHNLIKNNTQHGLALVGTSYGNLVVNNTFIDNAYATSYIIDGEREGTIQSQAYDEGLGNKWFDAENELGNLWSDFSGKGDYLIDGPSQSVDEYPQSYPQTERSSSELLVMILGLSISVVILSLKKR